MNMLDTSTPRQRNNDDTSNTTIDKSIIDSAIDEAYKKFLDVEVKPIEFGDYSINRKVRRYAIKHKISDIEAFKRLYK